MINFFDESADGKSAAALLLQKSATDQLRLI